MASFQHRASQHRLRLILFALPLVVVHQRFLVLVLVLGRLVGNLCRLEQLRIHLRQRKVGEDGEVGEGKD